MEASHLSLAKASQILGKCLRESGETKVAGQHGPSRAVEA